MLILYDISILFVAIMAFLSVAHAPYRRAALVITAAHFLNFALSDVFSSTNVSTYTFLSCLDLGVVSVLIYLHNKKKQTIMLKMSAISLCFVVVNLGTSWAMLNHVGNIFYYNYVLLIFTLNILQGLMFGKSGIMGLKNGLHTMVNVLGGIRGVYRTNCEDNSVKDKIKRLHSGS